MRKEDERKTWFPFGQPDKTKDCGYRCLYYVVQSIYSYDEWLNQFRFFQPVAQGINFNDICTCLDFYTIDFRFTQITEQGLFIIYSGIWLHHEGKKHGHYFIYENGKVLCSTHQEPYTLPLHEIVKRLEAKNIDHAFRCLKIIGPKPS